MIIRLRLFASLRELTGVEQEELTLPVSVKTLGEFRRYLSTRGTVWAEALDRNRAIRGAINQRMASDDDAICDGDEVAFFPPVTGG